MCWTFGLVWTAFLLFARSVSPRAAVLVGVFVIVVSAPAATYQPDDTTRLELASPDTPRLFDLGSGRELVDGRRGVTLNDAVRATPAIEFRPAANGFDVLATYTNHTDRPTPLGTLRVPSIAMPKGVTWYDFRRGSEPQDLAHTGHVIRRADHPYPGDLYSPVAVIADEHLAIGASLLYDVLELQHSINIVVRSQRVAPLPTHSNDDAATDRPAAWRWEILFRLNGSLPPGQTRTYTLCVRVTDAGAWINTLLPYRNHFQSTYGTLAYVADPRPVRGYSVAAVHEQSRTNPRGFTYPQRRPDRVGFAAWAREISTAARKNGFDRVMLWALSGLHANNNFNYPPIFVSGLRESPRAAQTTQHLNTITSNGITLGLWWGRSQQVLDSFSDTTIEFLDPTKPTHVAHALRQLDEAVALGGTTIGLDAFAYLPAWRAEQWLHTLQARTPAVRFVLEPTPPDVLHRLAPSYTRAEVITRRHALADLLLPGHESWAQIRFDTLRHTLGPLSPQQMQLEAERVAMLGFVPVLFEPIPDPHRAAARVGPRVPLEPSAPHRTPRR